MTPPNGSLPPDEAAFYAAWLGKLWPSYRSRFEGGTGRPFEWRSALHPLWLAVPGLWLPLVVVVAVVIAACAALVLGSSEPRMFDFLIAAGSVIAWWPVTFVALAEVSASDSGTLLGIVSVAAMFACSVALGMLAPRWIVAEGRRRWARHAARTAAGEAPAPPRAVTARSPLRTAALVVLAIVPLWLMFYRPHRNDLERKALLDMRSDLRALVAAEEAYFADSVRYTARLDDLEYERSNGVTLRIVTATDSGWSAVASHLVTERTCTVFVGAVAPPLAGAVAGEPACEGDRQD